MIINPYAIIIYCTHYLVHQFSFFIHLIHLVWKCSHKAGCTCYFTPWVWFSFIWTTELISGFPLYYKIQLVTITCIQSLNFKRRPTTFIDPNYGLCSYKIVSVCPYRTCTFSDTTLYAMSHQASSTFSVNKAYLRLTIAQSAV